MYGNVGVYIGSNYVYVQPELRVKQKHKNIRGAGVNLGVAVCFLYLIHEGPF